jgi:hypothetical protein
MRTLIFILLFNLLACASAKIHNQTSMFIDIEVDQQNAWIGCSDTDPKEENSLMTLYALHDNTTHEFMFRRVIEVDRCLKLEKEYQALAKGSQTVRLVGLHPLEGGGKLITDRVPQKFKDAKEKKTWTFIRFHTGKDCKSYFVGYCSTEKYWGGIVPPQEQGD